jgi:hypothetical protein
MFRGAAVWSYRDVRTQTMRLSGGTRLRNTGVVATLRRAQSRWRQRLSEIRSGERVFAG